MKSKKWPLIIVLSIIPTILLTLIFYLMDIEIVSMIIPIAGNFFVTIIVLAIVISISKGRTEDIIKRISNTIKLMVSGDFFGSFSSLKGVENSYNIVSDFQSLINSLMEMLEQFEISAQKNSFYSERLIEVVQETNLSDSEILDAIEGVSEGADHTAHSIENITKLVNNLLEHAVRLEEEAKKSSEIIEDFQQFSGEIQEILSNLTDDIDRTVETNRTSAENIRELQVKSEEISTIVSSVTQVSEQTNLLALNAAIEAARAGEAGRGFSVVAEEVRKLAEESNIAAEKISNTALEIKSQTQVTAANVEETVDLIEKNSIETKNTANKFYEMKGLIDSVKNTVNDILNFLEEDLSRTKDIFDEVDKVAAMAEETSASSEEVTATKQDCAHLAEGLNDISKQLHKMSLEQNKLTSNLVKESTLSENQDRATKDTLKLLIDLSKKPGLLDSKNTEAYLNEFFKGQDYLDFVYMTNKEGTVIASNNSKGIGANFSFRPWFIDVMEGNSHITKTYISLVTHKPCITMAAPLYDENSQITGSILTNLRIMEIK